jgi:hypothetical protein
MSRFATWLWMIVGMVGYRLLVDTSVTPDEHIAGAYFGGLCLFCHWLGNLGKA